MQKKVKLKAEIVAADTDAIIKTEVTLLLVEFYILVNIFKKTIKHWRIFFLKDKSVGNIYPINNFRKS